MAKRLLESIASLDWGRFSIKLAPIFIAYGAFTGLIASGIRPSLGWLPFVAIGVVAACLGGYFLPRKVYYTGPLLAQIGNCVFCAIAATAIFGLAFGSFLPSASTAP